MSNIILTDIDGVVIEWLNAFVYWMEKEHGHILDGVESWDLTKRYPNLENKEVFACIDEFNNGPIIANLIPSNDSYEVINWLNERGYKFIALTSLSDKPEALANRKANLEQYFGNAFIDVICLPTGSLKSDILKNYTEVLCWVEDHPKNADAGVDLGIHSFLMNQKHNEMCDTKAIRVDSWKDIRDWVIAQLPKEYESAN